MGSQWCWVGFLRLWDEFLKGYGGFWWQDWYDCVDRCEGFPMIPNLCFHLPMLRSYGRLKVVCQKRSTISLFPSDPKI